MKYVHTFTDRHGKTRHYFRRGSWREPLPVPGTAHFARAYLEAAKRFDAPIADRPVAQIRKHSLKLTRKRRLSGVYLLLLGERLVYIGSSDNMSVRVAAHRQNGRPFDGAYFINVPADDERLRLERILIATLSPEQNVIGKGYGSRTSGGNPESPGLANLPKVALKPLKM